VTSTLLLSAGASTSNTGGITGWLLHFNGTLAYVIVGLLAFAEAAFMVGFFFPGETAVVVGGVLAGLGRVNLGVMIVVVVLSAVIGDSVGYEVGKKAGPWLLQRRPPVFWREERPQLQDTTAVRYTLALLDKYGGPAVFLGRFIAFARVVIPGLAGMSGLRYRTFLFWNVLGGLCWGIGYTVLGYVVGISFEHVLGQIGLWSLAVVAVLVAGVAAIEVRRRRKERRRIELELGDLGGGQAAGGDSDDSDDPGGADGAEGTTDAGSGVDPHPGTDAPAPRSEPAP
jgi:membrane protein DedA with SNARE-associated domain